VYLANAVSNSLTRGPVVSQPLLSTSTTARISSSSIKARWKGKASIAVAGVADMVSFPWLLML
jgi:hypothetical protein